MNTGTIILIVIVALIVLIALYIGKTYNVLVRLRNKVKDQWSQIDVLLKRRADLIPNLVETVKGYASHESETLEAVIQARNKVVDAKGTEEEIKADGELTRALGRLMAVAESYPDLKANTNFLDLQNNLKETEDKIQYARQFYNDCVQKYNTAIMIFPTNMFAKLLKYDKKEYFKIEEKDKELGKISL